MLRSWTNKLEVYLHPQKVVVLRKQGLIKPQIVQKKVVHLVSESKANPREKALLELKKCLELPEFEHIPANVILSSHFLRYRLASWNDDLNQAEREALVYHQLREIYGPEIDDSSIFISDGSFRKNGVACAINRKFLEQLNGILHPRSSIQPFFVSGLDQVSKNITADGWLILVESGLISLALFKRGGWESIRSKQVVNGWEYGIQQLLEREAMQLGISLDETPIYIFWPENPGFNPKLSAQLVLLTSAISARYKLFPFLASEAC